MSKDLIIREKLKGIIDAIKNAGSLIGVILSDREGNLIIDNVTMEFDKTNCSSMCASVLESALALGRFSGDQKVLKIITEVEEISIIILECDENRFLTLFADFESKINVLLEDIENYIKKIVLMYEYD
jgi:predicted regulator of Ras-like GTPase activity (Roadblock/LC7/MglB family)